jgi:ATP-dependent Clp protease ATP-binding subunit ClpC
MLDQWGRDLNKLARMGKLADATGRDAEIAQVITILARTQKSNPLLLGEAGVGKTAVVEGLAWRIVNDRVPSVLRGKRIVEITMGTLEAGMEFRGQFEERVRQVLNEATGAPEVILFIDEMHTIVGAGSYSGHSADAAQMFKPALGRGDISCIGATTQDEYARFLRKDTALERRFTPVNINELSPEATLAVLNKVAPRIVEKQASRGQYLKVEPEALEAAMVLTGRYVRDRHQPDKSIDAIDIACARAVVWGHPRVTAEDIAAVVSGWTGIPAGELAGNEQARLTRMEETLAGRVVGQDAAIRAICRSVRARLVGLKQPNRPIGVFLFIGPSGVGKTQLAKELAAFLFHTPEALIRFDMNEYQEKYTVSNLIGSPRGYIGSEQGGQFTEALRRRPYSVVLLDEIEKAHPDILNLFLAVFDEGRITDNLGRVIDCSNAVFILTSNMATGKMGHKLKGSEPRALAAQFLRPELVNRITDVIAFDSLGRPELARILDRILQEKTVGFERGRKITVKVDQSVKDLILDSRFDPLMGARPLEREVDKLVVQPLVDAIFAGTVAPGRVRASTEIGKVVFVAES